MNRFHRTFSMPCLLLMVVGSCPALAQPSVAPEPVTRESATVQRKQASPTEEDAFTRFMRIGYAATAQFDYHTALINFQRALEVRPDNPYAMVAIENVEFYIERNRAAQRQREIDTLETRLATASEQKDWVCAAATVDQLVTYTDANSLNRQRLIGYRGELSGLINARSDLNSWSTVCTPDQPLL